MEILEGGQLLVMKRTRRLPWVAEAQWRKRSLEVRENAGAVQMGYLVVRPYGS